MSFTLLFVVLALLILTTVFGVTFKLRNLKTAFIVTAIVFVIFILSYLAMGYIITAAM